MKLDKKKITAFLIKILNDLYDTKSFVKDNSSETKSFSQIFSAEKKIAVNYFSSQMYSQNVFDNLSEVIKNFKNNKKFDVIFLINYIEISPEISEFITKTNENSTQKFIFWDKIILNKYLKKYENYLSDENNQSNKLPFSITNTLDNIDSNIFEKTFSQLDDLFFKNKKQICVIHSPIFGTGKSFAAINYASKNSKNFNHTAYIKITNDFRIDFINSFINSAIKFHYDKTYSVFTNYNKLIAHLKGINGHNLLIIDSVESIQHIAIIKNIAKKTNWKILIVSETKLTGLDNIKLQVPSRKDISTILKRYFSEKNAEIIANILEKTENNLFLTHFIGKQLKSHKKLSVNKLQQIFADKDEKIHHLSRYINPKITAKQSNLQKRIYKYVIGIYEFQVQNITRSQKQLLTSLCSLPLSNFTFNDLEKLLQINKKNTNNFVNDILELQEYGWIETNSNYLYINQTVKHILHKKLKPDSRSIKNIIEVINSKLQYKKETDFFRYISFGLSITKNITIASEAIINLSEYLGKVMNFIGFHDKATNHYNFAGEILENIFNLDNPTDFDFQRLSSLFLLANDFEKALYYGQSNADFMIQKFGNDSEQTADAYRILAIIHQNLEDIDNAIYYIDYALDIYEELFHEKHPSRRIANEIHTNLSKQYKINESFNDELKFINKFFKE